MPRHKQFERKEVLEKALQVFWCKGYNATSFQDLTEGMCINRQSIYDTYGDKHTLFIEALNYYSEKTNIATEEHFAQHKPVKELLKAYFENTVNTMYADPMKKGCFLANSTLEMIPHDEEVSKVVAQNVANLTKAFQKAISRGKKNGEIKNPNSAEVLASYLINTIQGLNTMGKTLHNKKKLMSIADVAVEAVV